MLSSLNKGVARTVNDAKSEFGLGAKKAVLYIKKQSGGSISKKEIIDEVAKRKEKTAIALNKEKPWGKTSTNMMRDKGFYSLQVQYNPASISISANADEVQVRSHQVQQADEIFIQKVRPPAVVLSMQLIFNKVDSADCFPSTIYNPSIKSTAKTVASFAGHKYSVRAQTNAFIGMMMQENTRVLCFSWADMIFAGELTSVDAKYTMFNTKGEPVHSIVSLSIIQTVQNKEDINYWWKAFDNFFEEGEFSRSTNTLENVVSGNSSTNKVKNILNIPFLK